MTEESLQHRERTVKHGELVSTPTLETVQAIFGFCQADAELGLVTGEPGVGKTSAARRYVAQMPGAHLVTMSPATSSLVACVRRIAEVLGVFVSGKRACAFSDAILTHLSYEMDPQLLLIDEAQHLMDAAVEEVRSIFDAASIGIVFIGNRNLRDRWSGKLWAQLNSRIQHQLDIGGALPEDTAAICAAAGVEGKRALALVSRVAARPGGLRLVRKLLNIASDIAGPGAPLKLEHLEAACRARGEGSL